MSTAETGAFFEGRDFDTTVLLWTLLSAARGTGLAVSTTASAAFIYDEITGWSRVDSGDLVTVGSLIDSGYVRELGPLTVRPDNEDEPTPAHEYTLTWQGTDFLDRVETAVWGRYR